MSINSLINNLPSVGDDNVANFDDQQDDQQWQQDPDDQQEEPNVDEGYEPDYDTSIIPEAFRPSRFANTEEELKFYREKYVGAFSYIQSTEFAEQFIETYQDRLASTEQEVSDFKSMLKAFQKDPHSFIAANMPEYAEQFGIGKVYSDDEIDSAIDSELAKEFGDDWREGYDPNDLMRRNSLTSKIFRRRQELEQSYDNHNSQVAKNKAEFLKNLGTKQQQAPPAQADIEAQADQLIAAYEEQFAPAGFTEDEFMEFVQEAKSYQPTAADLYNMVHFETLVEQERNESFEAGRKAILDELARAGKIAKEEYRTLTRENASAPPARKFMGMNISI